MAKRKSSGRRSSSALHEQLLYGDPTSLSNADLLALLLGSTDAVHEVLERYSTLTELDDASSIELCNLESLGDDSATRLIAAKELARRRAAERARRGTSISSSQAAYEIIEPLLRDETREILLILALDTKNKLLCSPITVSIGTLSQALVHPREVFRPLIRLAACSCILAHLHPSSGEPSPSPDDIIMTGQLKEAGELLCIPVLDHIVIGRGCYISMADRGLM